MSKEARLVSPEKMLGFAREALGISNSVSVELLPLRKRGSDRAFFRLKWGHGESAILVRYDPKRLENSCYADIAQFLGDITVSAPHMFRHDPVACLIVMEDLGDTDLWSLREAPWESRRALYQKTLIVVHRLHGCPEEDFPSGRVRLMEPFGPDLYRWERDYFRDNFVRGVCGIKLEPPMEGELEAELSVLAQRLRGTPRCLVHRDLQSQNVMIRDGEPYLIDFQGMRFGSPFYDLGSLLCDPYVTFSEEEREHLLSFYYGLSKSDIEWTAFRNYFWEASVQRLMQALGAYGFLGLTKGLTAFLEHIPAGLRNLTRAAVHVASLPRLQKLCEECRRVIEQKHVI